MGDMAEGFRIMKEEARKERKAKEPSRLEYAKQELEKLGYITTQPYNDRLEFRYKNNKITVYPYKGWFSGKGIKDGRGIDYLIKQLKESV
jgi:hypothetical protein